MEEAKKRFTNKYTGPVKKSFDKYYDILAGIDADDIYVDADINFTKEIQGMQRSINYLSNGQRDLIGICMRMALLEGMFRDEKPFVIFDDPFINLDEKTVANAKLFMDKIGKEYQVIYFTCHTSRKLA